VRHALAQLLLVSLLGLTACGRPHEGWAVDVAAKHREADRLLDAGDAGAGRRALMSLVADYAGGGLATAPRRLALQDAYFRLARLALAANDPRQALADAESGLELGTTPHLFVANLLVARGAAREALADARGAAEDYHEALKMNEALLDQALPL
jgi:tetratricopeptide (TPR) repeat protein